MDETLIKKNLWINTVNLCLQKGQETAEAIKQAELIVASYEKRFTATETE